jgi:hypothetical protein
MKQDALDMGHSLNEQKQYLREDTETEPTNINIMKKI